MQGGSLDFGKDVQEVFGDIIGRYNYRITEADATSVELTNDITEVSFYINEEVMTMYIQAGDTAYKVGEIARIADRPYYQEWLERVEATLKGLLRNEYYKNYLQFFHELSVKFLGDAWATGVVPYADAYRKMKAAEDASNEAFSRAWSAMQQLSYEDPVRQKYINNDPSWVQDMLARLG